MRLYLVLLVLSLNACSTLTKTQCKSDKWLEIGLVDSKNNRADDFYKKHIDACDSGDFKDDDYKKGWQQGISARKPFWQGQEKIEVVPSPEQLAIENENYKQVKALSIGSVIGLGAGHLLQGTYAERGWVFTLLEGSMLLVPVKGWVLLGFLGVKAYEVFDLSKYFYHYRLAYPD
jgi:hypothetical protein